MSTEQVVQTEQLHENYHLGKSAGIKRVTLKLKRNALTCTEAHLMGKTQPLYILYDIIPILENILGIFRILSRSHCRRYSATNEPVAEIQTQPITSAACLIRAERGLVHQSEWPGIPLVPFGGATMPNFRTDAPPNGIWALIRRLTQEKVEK
ncbi:uncharacterized protein B0H18DRAFT_957277 [Fomitopsis serialis]|uniref:uncharacterized protein n=1 Tax=Fomitopsis serialis TaxID=139415 RepID=UPI0020078239|nr:uncharacterized protein B0H18DRAFT_957277 [Neoantrodia serialis]KAH9919883.1 hypothetical protein B0H18DRAFT_957277 [Neoantrodia serialis]